jgi:selenide,water dikinase
VLDGVRKGHLDESLRTNAVRWMRMLNAEAAAVLRPFSPHAVTDVTGFGLFGHAYEMASRSGACVVLDAGSLPPLDGALEVAADGLRTGGDRRNREFAGAHVSLEGVAEETVALGFDPQTAGGLLVSLPAEKSLSLEAEFAARELFLRRVGRVDAGSGVAVA